MMLEGAHQAGLDQKSVGCSWVRTAPVLGRSGRTRTHLCGPLRPAMALVAWSCLSCGSEVSSPGRCAGPARRLLNLLVFGVVLASVLIFWVVPGLQRLSQPESFCPESFDSEKAPSSDVGGRTAEYTGPGPHSLANYEVYPGSGTGEVIFSASKPSQEDLPETWNPKYDDDKPVDVQLLLCVYNQKYRGEVSQTLCRCGDYAVGPGASGGRVPVQAAPVTYRLYEAAAKRLLTKFDLTATSYKPSDCPNQISYRTDESPAIWISPEPAAVAARLKSFVEASR
jgi:hypothetical protein